MISVYYFTAVIFFVYCSTTTFTKDNSTFQLRNNTSNGRSNTPCHLTSVHLTKNNTEIKEVLRLQYNTTTNTVKIKVSVASLNEIQNFPEIIWANEIGRTIMSLLRVAEDTDIFSSPIFTSILKISTKEVDFQIRNKTDGCLPPGVEGSDRIFDFFFKQLSHSGDTPVYKLCRVHQDESLYATYNCCRITGDRNLVVCDDYSSVVVTFAVPAVVGIFLISFFMVYSFVYEYITTYPSEVEFYKTSESHMTLSSVASRLFFQGREQAAILRRCIFVGLSLLMMLPQDFFGYLWLKVVFWMWAVLYVISYDVLQRIHKVCLEKKCQLHSKPKTKWTEQIIYCFTIPVHLLSEWKEKKCCLVLCLDESSGESSCLNEVSEYFKKCSSDICICILTILLFIVFFPLLIFYFLAKFALWDLLIEPLLLQPLINPCLSRFKKMLLFSNNFFIRLPTLAFSVFFTWMTLIFALFIVVGVSLNAEYFSPFLAPIFTLLMYFLKNWTFSVETKCLQLKTTLIEFCKDKEISKNPSTTPKKKNKKPICDILCPCIMKKINEEEIKTPECLSGLCSWCINITSCCTKYTSQKDSDANGNESIELGNIKGCSKKNENGQKNFIIKFDDDGETLISKELYEEIGKKILPFDHLLFYFFRRVIFVGLYAFVMFTVMILGRESGVSGSVQVISGVLGAMIPFLLDANFGDRTLAEKKSTSMATKEKLERILTVVKRKNNTIFVEIKNEQDEQTTIISNTIPDTSS